MWMHVCESFVQILFRSTKLVKSLARVVWIHWLNASSCICVSYPSLPFQIFLSRKVEGQFGHLLVYQLSLTSFNQLREILAAKLQLDLVWIQTRVNHCIMHNGSYLWFTRSEEGMFSKKISEEGIYSPQALQACNTKIFVHHVFLFL